MDGSAFLLCWLGVTEGSKFVKENVGFWVRDWALSHFVSTCPSSVKPLWEVLSIQCQATRFIDIFLRGRRLGVACLRQLIVELGWYRTYY